MEAVTSVRKLHSKVKHFYRSKTREEEMARYAARMREHKRVKCFTFYCLINDFLSSLLHIASNFMISE
jgi:hypothetical protein